MAFVATNTQAPLGAVTTLRVVDSILSLKNSIVDWNEARLTHKILSRMSAEQLEDIGLTRADFI